MLGHADEDCASALRRTLPDVLLVDATHPCADDPALFEEARALGVRLIALAPDGHDAGARALARRHSGCCVTLPTEYDLVPETLRQPQLA